MLVLPYPPKSGGSGGASVQRLTANAFSNALAQRDHALSSPSDHDLAERSIGVALGQAFLLELPQEALASYREWVTGLAAEPRNCLHRGIGQQIQPRIVRPAQEITPHLLVVAFPPQ